MGEGYIVEDPHHGAPHEPRRPEDRAQDAVDLSPALERRGLRDRCPEHGLEDPDPGPPGERSRDRHHRGEREGEQDRCSAENRDGEEGMGADTVERPADEQRHDDRDCHRRCVDEGDGGVGDDRLGLEVVGDERERRKPGHAEEDERCVGPDPGQIRGLLPSPVQLHLQAPGPRHRRSGDEEDYRDAEERDPEQEKPGGVSAGEDQGSDHDQRSDDRTGLVERLMDPKPPPPPDCRRRVGEDRVPGRCPDGLPYPLEYDEEGRYLPAPGKGKERDGDEQAVAGHRHLPVVAALADVGAGDKPERIPYKLAKPGNQPDDGRASPEEENVGAGDAPGAVRDQAPAEARHAEQQDEVNRDVPDPLAGLRGRIWHLLRGVVADFI